MSLAFFIIIELSSLHFSQFFLPFKCFKRKTTLVNKFSIPPKLLLLFILLYPFFSSLQKLFTLKLIFPFHFEGLVKLMVTVIISYLILTRLVLIKHETEILGRGWNDNFDTWQLTQKLNWMNFENVSQPSRLFVCKDKI